MDKAHVTPPHSLPSTEELEERQRRYRSSVARLDAQTRQVRELLATLGVETSQLTDRKFRGVILEAHQRLERAGLDTRSLKNWLWALTPDRPIH